MRSGAVVKSCGLGLAEEICSNRKSRTARAAGCRSRRMRKAGEPRPMGPNPPSTAAIATLGGKFTEPDITVNQMVEKVQAKMREMYIPGFMARSFTKDIPTLKRWAAR